MKRLHGLATAALLASMAAAATAAAQPLSKSEIEGARRYERRPSPAFSVLDRAAAARAIRVRASRSYAAIGYNTPALVVELPRSANSGYAIVRFVDAKPLAADGNVLPHEIENGLYDEETHSTQIRFVAAGGGEPVPLARAVGRVRVRYPVVVHTTTVRAGSPEARELGIAVDGPYVTFTPGSLPMPEASPAEGIEPLRAYDAAGRRLERYEGFQKSELSGDVPRKTVAFWGTVASVSFDAVARWEEIERSFDVAAAPLRPAGREGLKP